MSDQKSKPRTVLSEPVEIAKFWRNRRGEAVIVQLREYEGHVLADARMNFTNKEGKLQPTGKCISISVRRLPELAAALTKAERKARELGLIGRRPMSDRRRLSDRRGSLTFTLQASGLNFTATVSRFTDGTLGEIFLQNHKADSTAGITASDAAIAASLALQFGCPAETLRKALCRDVRGNSTGPLGRALDLLAGQL
jgi:hypothetical protein